MKYEPIRSVGFEMKENEQKANKITPTEATIQNELSSKTTTDN